jgi:hypothetical protein
MSRGTSVADADGKGDQPHSPGAQSADLGELPRSRFERCRDRVRVTSEHASRFGQSDTAADAFDESDAGALLEAPELLAHRRLAVAERCGGSGERAVLCDLPHDPNGLEVEGACEVLDGCIGHPQIISSGHGCDQSPVIVE